MFRALRIGLILALAPAASWAQSSTTPLLNTMPNSSPTIPFGGFQGPRNGVAEKAALGNASEVLGLLLSGESPNEADYLGRTGLIYAAINNNPLIGKILLEHGADVEARDKLGNTALHWAADRNSLDEMRQLLAFGCQVNAQNRQGITPLMMAAGRARAEAVRMLLSYKADPKLQDYTGRDAIGWAANGAIKQILSGATAAR